MISIIKGSEINIQKVNSVKFPECIESHMEVLQKKTHCGFGRFGKNIDKQNIINPQGYIFFYQSGNLYLAHIVCIENKPGNFVIPSVYESLFFSKGLYPKEYLVLDFIKKVDGIALDYLQYKGNKRVVSQTIGKCNASFLTCIVKENLKFDEE